MAVRSSASLFGGLSAGFRAGVAGGVFAFTVLIGAVLAFQLAYSGKVYPGVSVMGMGLGGRTPQEAGSAVEARFAQYAQTPLTVRHADQEWRAAPADLGLVLNADETVQRAFLVGRQGSIARRIVDQIAALLTSRPIEPDLAFDEARARAALTRFEQDFRRDPTSAGLVIGEDGSVTVTPSRTGLGLSLPGALDATRAAVLSLAATEIQLPSSELPVTLTEAELAKVEDRARRIVGQPLALTAGSSNWTLSRQDLARLLKVSSAGGSVDLQIDEAALTAHLERFAREFAKPPADSRLEIEGVEVRVIPGENGREIDVDSSRTMVLAQLGQTSSVRLTVKEIRGLQPEALADLKSSTEAILSGPATLTLLDRSYPLPPETLAEMLVVKAGAAGAVPTVEVDPTKLTAFVEGVAKRADREPVDARFRFEGGKLTVVSEAVEGVKVDVPASVEAVLKGLTGPKAVIPLRAEILQPEITSANAPGIVVRDLIMDSKTNFAGAIPEKVHNIRLAATRLNGTAVPPGGVFSFNRALGPATLASGFKTGYGITLNSAGQMETVPSEAGGICQVATTLFHSVFWAGYPIVERNWHLYWIPRYGYPPRGLKGLDATVDDAYAVDFKFKNNTENWVVVEAKVEGNDLSFALRGIKPTWKVTVGQPVITRIVPANRETVRQAEPTMPVGWALAVEAAEDGFSAAIDRTVSEGDRVIDKWTARATYRPSRNVVLYGTKPVPRTPQPSATPAGPGAAPQTTPTPAPAGSPAPAATPTPTRTR